MREAEARGKTTTREDDARAIRGQFVQRFELTRVHDCLRCLENETIMRVLRFLSLRFDLLAFSDLCTIGE